MLRNVVSLLCARLDGVTWALTGSLGMALQGVPLTPHDVDVQTDAAGAYEIQQRLAEFATRPVAFSAAERVRSHFGVFLVHGVPMEVMGDIEKRRADGTWEPPPDLPRIIRYATLDRLRVPVLDLAYEIEAYTTLGRLERAAFLRAWLTQQGKNSNL